MKRIGFMVLAALALAVALSGQSARIGPPRLGGDPMFVSNNAFPLSVLPINGSSQKATISTTASGLFTDLTFTVLNADFVSIVFEGFSAEAGTTTTTCPTLDLNGIASLYPCTSMWLTTTKIDQTHVQVEGRRFDVGNATKSSAVSVSVTDLNPLLIDNVQRGTIIQSQNPKSYTACPAGLTATEFDFLGSSGADVGQRVSTINASNFFLSNTASMDAIYAYQIICWKFHQ